MSNDFFSQMAHQLYTYNYKINDTDFFNYSDYIETKHEQAEFKGVSFYKNLIHAMPRFGGRIADINKGEVPSHQEKVFKEVLKYCKTKIDEIGEPTQTVSLSSIFNENNNSFEVCKDLLEYLEITINGIPNTSPGRIGKLTGLITAIKNTPGMLILESPKDKQLLQYFNTYLNTEYITFSKRNEAYKPSLDDSQRYIKTNFKK